MNINDTQDEIIEHFSMLPDWHSKYEYLLDMEDCLPVMDAALKTDESLVHGCNSKAWIQAELQDGKLKFTADGETAIARGILALIIKILDNRTPDEILASELYFIDSIGLMENLSMTRAQGLEHLIEKIYALTKQLQNPTDP
ncbi:MAG: SufE family protein [Gammaproteobacteria bacterium]|nr:SufE family protein [Gammaproteobacteria bacterium]